MPQVEIGSDPTLELKTALLVYESDGYGYEDKREVVVTQHKVERGRIMPGAPLDLDAFRKLLDSKSVTVKKDRSEWTWHFPRLLSENDEWRVWWSPAGMKQAFIGNDDKEPTVLDAWIPALVWAAHRSRPTCYLFAYDGKDAPNQQTTVYHPRFGPEGGLNHVHPDCAICVGSMKLDGNKPEHWEKAFWNSRFKEPGTLKHNKPYGCKKVFKQIGPLSSALTRCRSAD